MDNVEINDYCMFVYKDDVCIIYFEFMGYGWRGGREDVKNKGWKEILGNVFLMWSGYCFFEFMVVLSICIRFV